MNHLIIVVSLLIFLICVSVFAQQFIQSDDYLVGKSNGEQAANGSVGWAVAGFGCGCFGIGFAYLKYIQGYRNKARNANIVYATIG
jgi:hypothetical protein